MPTFTVGDTDFELDGRPHRILSGALHYFRVHPAQWADRIDKARRMGLNTIETYVPWNAHSPARGEFDTAGGLDLDRFLRLVADAGMHAIVRPGPYICAEWYGGGLPTWLWDGGVAVRTRDPKFLDAVGEYLDAVLAVVAPHQVGRGGPVVLVQVENEYGAYGDDHDYLVAVRDRIRDAGITVPLVTVDQPTEEMLAAGRVDGAHMTASFGSRAAERLATLRRHQRTGPLMCGEFWVGWFDHWGAHHHTTPVEAAAAELDTLLAAGASVNIYMFHGGTNFALTAGANDKGVYQPQTTSYDYDAPLDEAGDPTPKYHAFREVIARYATVPGDAPAPAPPAPAPVAALGDPVRITDVAAQLGRTGRHEHLPLLDELAPVPNLMLARTRLDGPDRPGVLTVGEVRDRIRVFLDGAPVGTLLRDHHERALALPSRTGELTLLVEDLGRVNYGERLGEPKGAVGGVHVDGVLATGWEVTALDPATVPTLWDRSPATGAPVAGPLAGPVAVRAVVDLDAPSNLFLDTSSWGTGLAWCNGFLLGRYWSRGPQRTLYVPEPVTRTGDNTVVVLELAAFPDTPRATFVPGLDLGHTDI